MKCSQALETMLDADPADLSPESPSALGLHLRSCAKCARVAATMRADVHALAAVMPAVSVSTSWQWVRWQGVALASAAAVLLFVVTRGHPVPTARTQPADTAPVVAALPTETVKASTTARTARTTTSDRRVASSFYAMPDPEPLEVPADLRERASTARASEPAFDGVSATSNGSVTVLKASNPKITVIWFK